MTSLTNVVFAQTGKSQTTNNFGMRPMQERVFDVRNSQYTLIKAPPASGKSRALMFLALDKLHHQGRAKAIISVPERSIGSSFKSTKLTEGGFFADWSVDPQWDLTDTSGSAGKVDEFLRFMKSPDKVLVCTHATLRFAFEALGPAAFDDCLVAIDEFHHASADIENKLGEVVRALLRADKAHIIAMTGSYFRGDAIPVLTPDDEEKFTRVTYTYYEQLNGYRFLKTLGIGYHFYRGPYTEAIHEAMDPARKTIIHIPRPNAAEASDDKYEEVGRILDHLGTVKGRDAATGFYKLQRPDGSMLTVADLVDDDEHREKVVRSLRLVKDRDEVDFIIALGMAKEGFDWIWCEHALTVGYRGSLTEVVQIIGRTTRDAPAKTHAQFTNLIAEPDAKQESVVKSVNDMLKAIACSLLMEQVLAPNFKFKTRLDDDDIDGTPHPTQVEIAPGSLIEIKGLKEPSTERSRQIVESDLLDLSAKIFQDDKILKAMMSDEIAPEVINRVYIPEIVERTYPSLTEDEVEEVSQAIVADAYIKNVISAQPTASTPTQAPVDVDDASPRDARFVQFTKRLINIDTLDIELIEKINPFQRSFEVLSKTINSEILRRIHGEIVATRIPMTEKEALALYERIKAFKSTHNREPELTGGDPLERRLAEALAWLRRAKRQRENGQR